MYDGIKTAFDGIKADEGLKMRTKRFVAEKAAERRKTAYMKKTAVLACTAAAAVFAVCGMYFTPTMSVSIDINPSVELKVNRFDKVISAVGYNADGEALVKELNLTFKSFDSSAREVISSEAVKECIANDEVLSITVAGKNEVQTDKTLETVQLLTENTRNAYCTSADYETAVTAAEYSISCGKYSAYLELAQAGVDISPEEVGQMSMREIRELLDSETDNDAEEGYVNQSGLENDHNGHGQNCPSQQSGNRHQYGKKN